MECPVCLNNWEEHEFTPLLLICGHSLCAQCVFSLISGSSLACPSCYQQHAFETSKKPEEDLADYKRRCIRTMTRNMTLLSLISSRPSLVQPQPKKATSGRKYSKGQRCPDHHELIVCFTDRPFSYLCLQCIEEVKHMNLQIKPIPEVVDQLQANIKTTLTGCARKLQALELTKKEMDRVRLEPLDGLTASIEKHFASLQGNLKRASGELQDYVSNRIENILHSYSSKLDQVYSLQAELEDEEGRIERTTQQAPSELASKYLESDNILAKAMRPLPEIETSDATFKVRVKPEAQDEFSRMVKASVQLSSEVQQGWICKNCAEENSPSDYSCEVCQNFRSLDTYPTLMTQPERASAKEIDELSKRRQTELHIISELDTGEETSLWYLINAEWITQWKSFVFNKPSSFPEQNSSNKAVGVLPPGPISNHKLFTDPRNPVVLRPQLKVVNNYRGVNEKVWKAYFKFYGGGPVITRRKLNIYDDGMQRASSSVI
mmetsp:Transcript_30083/g.53338  ORF Transcript_30083/g.53338 Transcript_30083/m.53338 type:complete len:490 (+) Transcript_30083:15-1484(+)